MRDSYIFSQLSDNTLIFTKTIDRPVLGSYFMSQCLTYFVPQLRVNHQLGHLAVASHPYVIPVLFPIPKLIFERNMLVNQLCEHPTHSYIFQISFSYQKCLLLYHFCFIIFKNYFSVIIIKLICLISLRASTRL